MHGVDQSQRRDGRAGAGIHRPLHASARDLGSAPIEWYAQKRAVWAWVTWPNRAATREAAWATGGNDRVVMLEVPCEGGHWAPVVWRNAVSVRQVDAA